MSHAMASQSGKWAILALILGGWFLHDLVLHLGLLTVPSLIEFEYGLPTDLSSRGITPEPTSQLEGVAFALGATLILIAIGVKFLRAKRQT